MPSDAKTGWTAAATAFVLRIHLDLQVLGRFWCETKLTLGLNNFFLSDMTKIYNDVLDKRQVVSYLFTWLFVFCLGDTS